MNPTTRIDIILSTLAAMDIGSLASIESKLVEVRGTLADMGQGELADRAGATLEALRRGDMAEFRRGRAFLQAKIGHLR